MKPKRKGLITRRQLARRTRVHLATIHKWENAGMPVALRGGRGLESFFDWAVVQKWRKDREASARAATNGPLDPMQARANRDKFQAMIAEQLYRSREKELLPAGDVLAIWAEHITAARAVLIAAVTTKAPEIERAAKLSGVKGVEAALRALVDEALAELARPDDRLPAAPAQAAEVHGVH